MLQADLGRKSPPRAKPREDPLAASTTFWEDVVQVSTPLGKCDTAHGGPNDKEGMRGCRRAATLVPTLKDTAAQRVNVNSCRAGASCCVLCARSSDFILLDRTNTAFSCGLVDGFLSYCQTRRFLSSKVSSTVKEDHICNHQTIAAKSTSTSSCHSKCTNVKCVSKSAFCTDSRNVEAV